MSSTRQRRLALIHYTAPPVAGGVEGILGEHARLLASQGHDVRVIAGQGQAQVVPEASSRHPEVESVCRALARGQPVDAAFERLKVRLEARLDPLLADRDLIIAHNVLTMPFNLPLAQALTETQLPILAWTHDLAWVNPRYREYQRPGPIYDLLHHPQPHATYVAISQVRQREITAALGLPLSSVPYVPNGIDALGFWGISPATESIVRRAGLEPHHEVVLVPVRITRRKQLELAVEAAARLKPSHPALRVVISGPLGPHNSDNVAYAADLQSLRRQLGVEQTVRFLYELAGPGGEHPVDSRSTAELYQLADCVLLPSESEGFGLPALEAGLARSPLVAADIEVLREVAGDGTCWFSPGSRPEVIAGAVTRALASSTAQRRRRVLERYNWPAIVRQIESLIEATLR